MFFGKRDNRRIVLNGNPCHALRRFRNARIAGNRIDFLRLLALRKLPDESMLPPAASNHQYIHKMTSHFAACSAK